MTTALCTNSRVGPLVTILQFGLLFLICQGPKSALGFTDCLLSVHREVLANSSMPDNLKVPHVCKEYHMHAPTALTNLRPAQRFSFYVIGILGSATVFIGLVINILALTHLTIYKNSLGPRYGYIIGMSIWDNCLLLTGWTTLSLSVLIGRGHVVTHGHLVVISRYGQVVMNVSMLGVVWSTTAITIERFVAVCHSSRCAVKRTRRRSQWWFPVTAVVFVLYNLPRFFEITVSFCCDLDTMGLVPQAEVAEFALPGKPYFLWYKTISNALLVTVGPFVLLCFLTTRIVLKIRQSRQLAIRDLTSMMSQSDNCTSGRSSMGFSTGSSSAQYSTATTISMGEIEARLQGHRKLNKSLILILIKFVVCHTLCTINDLIQCIAGSEKIYTIPFFTYLVDVGDYLIMAHSATSGLVFLICSRQTLRQASRGNPHQKDVLSANSNNPPRKQDSNVVAPAGKLNVSYSVEEKERPDFELSLLSHKV